MLKRRIMIVDDHPMFRLAFADCSNRIRAWQWSQRPRMAIKPCIEADIHKPAVVLMDVQLPGVTGLHMASALRRERPTTSVMFLSMHVDDDRLFSAVRVGAAAFLTKDTEPQRILETVHAVLKGDNLLHQAVLTNPELARRVLGEFRSLSDGNGRSGG